MRSERKNKFSILHILRYRLKTNQNLYILLQLFTLTSIFQFLLQVQFPSNWELLGNLDKIFLIFFILFFTKQFIQNDAVIPTLPYKSIICLFFFGMWPLLFNLPDRIGLGFAQYLLTFQGLLVLVLSANLKTTEAGAIKYLVFLLLLGIAVFLVGLIEFFLPNSALIFLSNGVENFQHNNIRFGFETVQSVFPHPNLFSWFMGFCFCISLAFYHISGKKIYLFLAVVFLVGAFLGFRKRTLLSCVVVFFLSFYLKQSKKNKLIQVMFFTTIAATLFIVVSSDIVPLLDSSYTSFFADKGFHVRPRIELARTSFDIANDSFPFGSGLSTYGSYTSSIIYSPVYSDYALNGIWGLSEDNSQFLMDTYWPMVIAEFGWIGLLLVGFLWLSFLSYIVNTTAWSQNAVLLKNICILTLTQLIIESFSTPALSRSPQILMVMVVIGMYLNLVVQHRQGTRKR